jgi:hypothetical protein
MILKITPLNYSLRTLCEVFWKKPLLFNVVFLPEPLNPSGSVYQLLFAGKERVAGGTNFNLDVLDRGTGFDDVPAGTAYFGHLIFGMNLLFHAQILQ